jgi:hypothetical protein
MWDWLLSGVLPEVSEQWNYAMITLVVRFIGVFVVMFIMQVALQASASVVRLVEKRQAGTVQPNPNLAPVASAPIEAEAHPATAAGLEDATIAAIGLALALESRQPSSIPPSAGPPAWSSPWRIRQLPRLPGR